MPNELGVWGHVTTLHKKGNQQVYHNYRGITLISTCYQKFIQNKKKNCNDNINRKQKETLKTKQVKVPHTQTTFY